MTAQTSGRPLPGEYSDHAAQDIEEVAGDDAVTALLEQCKETLALFERFGEDHGDTTYAEGKWTVKQVLGHLVDDERIFAYRILCIARSDPRPLAGFDENAYTSAAGFEKRTLEDLLADYASVRSASVALLRGLDRDAWLRTGIVDGYQASARGLAFHIAGHELHHHRVVRERYLPVLQSPQY